MGDTRIAEDDVPCGSEWPLLGLCYKRVLVFPFFLSVLHARSRHFVNVLAGSFGWFSLNYIDGEPVFKCFY